jgi:hypothetical protein
LGNPVGILQNFAIILIPGLFTPGFFIGISFFPIVNFVPANLEHVPAKLEYIPAIDSSNFMHQKAFPLFSILPTKLHLLIFQVKQVDVILAGKDIASVFSEILPDASVQTMPLRFG